MSGPITAGYLIVANPILLAAAASIYAAKAVREGYAAEAEAEQIRSNELKQSVSNQWLAEQERGGAIRAQANELERRHARLYDLMQQLQQVAAEPAISLDLLLPSAPSADEEINVWVEYSQALSQDIAALELKLTQLQTQLKTQGLEDSVLQSDVASQDYLHAFARQQAQYQGASAEVIATRQAKVQLILARGVKAGVAILPAKLERLAKELIVTGDPQRADLLATELSYQMQQLITATHAQALQLQQQCEQEAAALVLQQALVDLGYDVSNIEQTLFIEGGVAHFQRRDWGHYFVRLRVDAKKHQVNFNVVRAKNAHGEQTGASPADTLAEDRWCSEFPKLLETLAARGLELTVTRRLEAGEIPVQLVSPESLPQFSKRDEGVPAAVLRQIK